MILVNPYRFGSGGGGGSVSRIQSVAGTNNFGGTTAGNSFLADIAAGNKIVVGVQWNAASGVTIASVTDSLGNTYTVNAASLASGLSPDSAQLATQFAYATAASSGPCTVTVTFSASVGNGFCNAFELSPCAFDQVSTGTGTGFTPSAGTVTTANNGSFGIAIAYHDDNAGAGSGFSAGAGWTLDQNTGGGATEEASEYIAQAAAGILTGDFSNSRTGTWYASLIIFKP